VTLTYFCYGWSLWLFLNWLHRSPPGLQPRHQEIGALRERRILRRVVGDALGGIISDHLLHKTGNVTLVPPLVIVTGMLGATACLIPSSFAHIFTLALCLSRFSSSSFIGPSGRYQWISRRSTPHASGL